MRTDQYMMAKAWMKQDKAPRQEALETWKQNLMKNENKC